LNEIKLPKRQKERKIMSALSEKLQWLLTTLNTFHSVVDSIGGLHQKLPESIRQKIPEFFGQIDSSGKTLEEELLVTDLINNSATATLGPKIDSFIMELQKQERGEEKATAFRVFLASGIKKNSHKQSFSVPNPDGKGNPIQETHLVLDLEWGKKFAEELFAKETFADRIKFLENRGVFSTMKKKKDPHSSVTNVRKKIKKTIGSTKKWLEEFDANKFFTEKTKTVKKKTKSLKNTAIGKPYEGFWRAGFPNKWRRVAFIIFTIVVSIMLAGGLICS
jgi:hypothetical protein